MKLKNLIRILLLGWLLFVTIRFFRRIGQAMRQPQNHPKAFLARGGKNATSQRVVVCVGDSITHGVISANYVDLLVTRYATHGYEFVNAGINGNLAWNVLQRLDDVIACQPHDITLLIGTNDVNATYSDQMQALYLKEQHLPEPPTLAGYRQHVEQILDRLQAETQARIAVIQIPLLGEDPSSEMNQRVDQYNQALQSITATRGIPLLPLNDRMKAKLPQPHTPPAYTGNLSLMSWSLLRHEVLRQSWDTVSQAHQLTLLTDHIHLNDRAALLVVELVDGFLNPSQDA